MDNPNVQQTGTIEIESLLQRFFQRETSRRHKDAERKREMDPGTKRLHSIEDAERKREMDPRTERLHDSIERLGKWWNGSWHDRHGRRQSF
jgi:hypothetical protein